MTIETRPGKILLVEDTADDITLTLRALKRNSIVNEVAIAKDGVEALAMLGIEPPHNGPLPALVLLDLKVPKLDGLAVLRRIRAEPRLRRLPVVILTSSSEQRDVIESYDLGANSYIRKPVDFQQFAEAVKTLGLYWLVLNEPPPSETA
jgi:two-component system, response regulator